MTSAALFLAALLQGANDESLERRVERYVAGDDAQAAALRSAGPAAMLLLRPHRANAKVVPLAREIRELAASPEDRGLAKKLAGLRAKAGGRMTFVEAVDVFLGSDLRWTLDPRETEKAGSAVVSAPKEGAGPDVLEDLCSQANLDFAFLYGIILVAPPERLWLPPPPRSRPLSAEEKARASVLVAKLGAESPDDREKAAGELRRLGPPVLPVLEAAAFDPDAEVASRCRGLTLELRPLPPPVFGPPGAARQKLAAADEALYKELQRKATTYKVKDLNLKNSMKLLLAQVEGVYREGSSPDAKLSFSFENLPSSTILAILTQAYGMDYLIEEGRVVVAPREEIERLLSTKK